MQRKSKQPLMRPSHLPLILLGAAITVYGLVTALVGSWFSTQAMRGLITAGTYRSQMAVFDQTAGLVAGIVFLVLFIWCAVNSSGIVRTAFSIGAVASVAPILAARAENLLFNHFTVVLSQHFTMILFRRYDLLHDAFFKLLPGFNRFPQGLEGFPFVCGPRDGDEGPIGIS